jgi:hypothetical protein
MDLVGASCCDAGPNANSASTISALHIQMQRFERDLSILRDQAGTIAGTGEAAVPGPLSENETLRPERLGTGSKSRVTRHQSAVVDGRANNQDLSKIIFPYAGRLVTNEASLCNDALIVYNCW